MSGFKQAPRTERDGPFTIHWPGDDGTVIISVTDNGAEQTIRMSEYNAARLLGGLALVLGVPLSARVSKAIKL